MTDSAEQVAQLLKRLAWWHGRLLAVQYPTDYPPVTDDGHTLSADVLDAMLALEAALRSSGWRTDVVERGSIVVALKDWRAIGNRPGLTAGRTYVVNEITHSSGWTYYKVITDDNEAMSLSSGMFALQIPAPPVLPQPPASTEG